MLYSLKGKLIHRDTNSVAIECGGVGYHCQTTFSTLAKLGGIGEEVTVFTYMLVRQDALDLFAFAEKSELNCFKMLTSVSGVGPKAGLAILSAMTSQQVAMAIASGDYKSLTAAQGIGPKIAQRIVLELGDKIKKLEKETGSSIASSVMQTQAGGQNAAEAISALAVLGFAQGDAAAVITKLDPAMTVEEMIKAGLKALS